MESFSWRALALTAFAPAAWGTTYLVTERLLPPERPLLSATLRALSTGLPEPALFQTISFSEIEE